jgi:hypothetical protein
MAGNLPSRPEKLRLKSNRLFASIAAIGFLIAIGVFIVGALSMIISAGRESPVPNNLENLSPDEILGKSMAEKKEMEARFATAQAEGALNPARKELELPFGIQSAQDPPFRAGIIEGEPGPFYSGEFSVQNLWQAEIQGSYVQVFAGALAQEPLQGVVIVLTHSKDKIVGDEQWYFTPMQDGSVRVIEAANLVLHLESAGGTEISFDVVNRGFLLPGN